MSALAAYVRSLPAPPQVAIADDLKVARGRAIFNTPEASCASCHDPKRAFSDGSTHDVSSRASADKFTDFRTPSLARIGQSAPYFHDGRYATLQELLRKSDGSMGATRHLHDDDLAALEAYLRTL